MVIDNKNEPIETVSHFRPEIQGLRGVAVLLGVLYHSGIGFSGGYVGVDVFFVISGFVITLLLLRNFEQGQPRILMNFYQRRVLRLLPASSLTVFCVIIFSILAFSPKRLSQVTVLAQFTSVFLANLKLLTTGGYFTLLNPLQHMWSLAVEEQFYLLFPVCFYVIVRFTTIDRAKRLILVLITGVALLSFIGNHFLSSGRGSQIIDSYFHTRPETFSFYMMPSRIWEFSFGIVLALIPQTKKLKFNQIGTATAVFGFSLIGYATFMFDSETRFPGYAALVPVLGTTLILRFARYSGYLLRLLTSSPMRFIGDISYSWYLWHWPLIVFALTLFPNIALIEIFAAVLSLIPAILSYRFVETKYRNLRMFTSRYFLVLLSLCIFAPIITAFGVNASLSILSKPSPSSDMYAVVERRFSEINKCQVEVKVTLKNCFVRSANSRGTVVMFGDSHAASASDGVVGAAAASHLNVGLVTMAGCPPFLVERNGTGCLDKFLFLNNHCSIYDQT